MNRLKCVIIDDEKHARVILRELLKDLDREIEVVGEGSDLPQAVKLMNEYNPDILFLDIEMPNYSGLQIGDFMHPDKEVEIVFVTAYDQYAIDAIRLSAFDYLLKPVQPDDLRKCIERYKRQRSLKTHSEVLPRLQNLSNNLEHGGHKKIAIRNLQHIHYLDVNTIDYVEASGMYSVFHTRTDQIVSSKPIKEYEDVLGDRFYRIHRTYIVNLEQVEQFSSENGAMVVLKSGKSLPVARAKKPAFLRKVEQMGRQLK